MTMQARLTSLATAIANTFRDSVYPRLLPNGGTTGQLVAKAASGFVFTTPVPEFARTWVAGAVARFNDNPHARPLIGLASAQATTAADAYTQSKTFTTHAYALAATGGTPSTTGGVTTFPALTAAGTTKIGSAWRVSTLHDGTSLVFVGDRGAPTGYRVLVDGRYTHTLPAMTGSGAVRYLIPLGARAVRTVTIEGQGSAGFRSIDCLPGEAILPPLKPSLRVAIVGDSNPAGTAQTYANDSVGRVIADHLGVEDYWQLAVAGTGFLATNNNTNNAYSARAADFNSITKDILVICGSPNDVSGGFTAAQVKAAAITLLTNARAAHAGPIFVVGMPGSREYFSSANLLTTFQAHEQALKEAAEGFASPLVRFIPMLGATGDTPMTGTGPGTGNWDRYTLPDATGHLTTEGHRFMGRYLAMRIIEAVAAMAGVGTPSFVPVRSALPVYANPMAALEIDCQLPGAFFTKTIAGNSTLSFKNVPPAGVAYACTVELTHTSGTLTHPTGTVFSEASGGLAPTLTAGKTHLLYYQTSNGGVTWRCSILPGFPS